MGVANCWPLHCSSHAVICSKCMRESFLAGVVASSLIGQKDCILTWEAESGFCNALIVVSNKER